MRPAFTHPRQQLVAFESPLRTNLCQRIHVNGDASLQHEQTFPHASAEAFFTEELRERVTVLYGVGATIDFLEITEIVDNTRLDDSGAGGLRVPRVAGNAARDGRVCRRLVSSDEGHAVRPATGRIGGRYR